MKRNRLTLGILAASIAGFLAFSSPQSAIVGSVSPADGVDAVWAVSKIDSVKGVVINTGGFSLPVKPGTYKVIVDAKSPYKDVELPNLEVKDNQPLDIGEIVLKQ